MAITNIELFISETNNLLKFVSGYRLYIFVSGKSETLILICDGSSDFGRSEIIRIIYSVSLYCAKADLHIFFSLLFYF